jgi:hypothetical protein
MTRSTGKFADPEWRRKRASKAGKARHSLDAYVRSIVDRAPELTAEQRAKLAVLLQVPGGDVAKNDAEGSAA